MKKDTTEFSIKKFTTKSLILAGIPFIFVACNQERDLEKRLTKLLEEKPEIVIKSIKSNPEKYMAALSSAAKESQKAVAQQRKEREKSALEKSFENPIPVSVDKSEAIRGPYTAPITLVEYSDFECPFCSKGNQVVEKLQLKYGKKIRVVYKHLPLSFHAQALISAKYFEAIKLQSVEKAFEFHDEIFRNQSRLSKGEVFLKRLSKKLKLDMKKLVRDVNSKTVMAQIDKHRDEAAKLGFQGTPGFILNGIPVRGAYPASHFEKIIDELIKRRKLTI
ncbi:MAG: protein-disulfide isomerase [Thermoproteota archaeon]|jgi:protein-disulfide isomerase